MHSKNSALIIIYAFNFSKKVTRSLANVRAKTLMHVKSMSFNKKFFILFFETFISNVSIFPAGPHELKKVEYYIFPLIRQSNFLHARIQLHAKYYDGL